ncbi:60S acidic ribosomal protein P2 [Sarcoptes scabiei]|uniref:Large ribosomal subunit protein P2 n=1 Tax=Sarcoptes scabiei TaxID=52283 RepID=A0A834VD77_SARSC|nr:60S acidic ribosomal protein P2 [Sarcoptes scabiei]
MPSFGSFAFYSIRIPFPFSTLSPQSTAHTKVSIEECAKRQYIPTQFLSSSLFSRCGQNVSGLLDLKMRYVAAYLLAVLGGNKSPSKDDINKILSSVGIESDEDKMSKVINELKGKSIEDLISQGTEKLASVPSGGGGGGAVAAAAAPAAAAPAADDSKKAKEEKKEEEEEEDDDMGFGLFD